MIAYKYLGNSLNDVKHQRIERVDELGGQVTVVKSARFNVRGTSYTLTLDSGSWPFLLYRISTV